MVEAAVGVCGLGSLSEVLRWCWREGVDVSSARLVELDEFDREMVIPIEDGQFLVIGAT